MNTDEKLNKQLKNLLKIAEKAGLSSLSVTNSSGSISFVFGEKKPFKANKSTPMSREDKDKLRKLHERANIDEMKLVDPLAYEEAIATGQLTDELEG